MNRATLLAIVTLSTLQAQTTDATRPKFEVASIKPTKEQGAMYGVGNGDASEHAVTVKMLIGLAYRLQEFEIVGGPAWASADRFNIEAKAADPNADPNQLRLMLQSLLADRFNLKVHTETKQNSVYLLEVAKNGPRIKLSADQTSPDVSGPSAPGAGPNHGAFRFGPGAMTGNAVTLSLFTRFLSQRMDRTILDKTGLTGRYDIQLSWQPGEGENPLDPGGNRVQPAGPDPSRSSIFVAIEEQLGLKMQSAKAPIDLLRIDSLEHLSEN